MSAARGLRAEWSASRLRPLAITACAGATLLCLRTTNAGASDLPLTLTWKAPAECPSAADLEADVLLRLGGSVSGKPVRAVAEVTRQKDSTWRVVLSTTQDGAAGRRTLDGPTCAAVASATALILALTIDPRAAALAAASPPAPPPPPSSPPPTAPPSPPPPPTPVSAPVRAPAPVPDREPATGWQLLARAAPTVGFGVEGPVASAGFGVAVGGVHGRLSLELTATSFLPASHDVSGEPGVGGTFWLLAVGSSVCGAWIDGPVLRGGSCVGIEYQRLHGAGYGIASPGSSAAEWTAPTLAPFFGVRLARALWVVTRVDAAVPLREPTFSLGNVGRVLQVSPVSLRLSIGVELRF
jgi:hypothetical protein